MIYSLPRQLPLLKAVEKKNKRKSEKKNIRQENVLW